MSGTSALQRHSRVSHSVKSHSPTRAELTARVNTLEKRLAMLEDKFEHHAHRFEGDGPRSVEEVKDWNAQFAC